jgi:outer membrane lipoprotein-sorting protein
MLKTKRRNLFLGALASILAFGSGVYPAIAADRKIPLNEISSYFNAMKGSTAGFTQVNSDGTLSLGDLKILRPGRIRFDYNPPEKSLVMASGGQVAIFDGDSNALVPERYPLNQTPLNIILEKNVDLARRNMVVSHTMDGVKTIVRAQDPDRPEYGYIDLVFTDAPIELRQWIVTDDTGSTTTVILNNLASSSSLSTSAFNIDLEMRTRQR